MREALVKYKRSARQISARIRGSYPTLRWILMVVVLLSVLSAASACSNEDPVEDASNKDETTSGFRYIDRRIFFSKGVSVTPEQAAAQEVARKALEELQLKTDLGPDYFIFDKTNDSVLQPLIEKREYEGREWQSFVQIWSDDVFDKFVLTNIGAPSDPDLVVATNKSDDRQFYILVRLSCFLSGDECRNATEKQAKLMVWRAVGYATGLRYGKNATTPIMKPGTSSDQETTDAEKVFIREFNNMLERLKLGMVRPDGSKPTLPN